MSFWDNVKKFTQPYADDEYDDYEDDDVMDDYEEGASEHSSESGLDFGYSAAPSASASGSGFSGQVLNMSSGKQDIVLFRPGNFNDTSKAADDLRDKKAIIVNMENVDKALARRVVDFLSGCAYSLDGKVNKIAHSTYLFVPHSMEVVGDLEAAQAEAESYI